MAVEQIKVPSASPAPNQGGTPRPQAAKPKPYVPAAPVSRAKKDSIVRPVIGAPGAPKPGMPGAGQQAPRPLADLRAAPPPPAPATGLQQQAMGVGQPQQPGQIDPKTGQPLQPGQPAMVETKTTNADGSVTTTKGPPGTSAGAQAGQEPQKPEEQPSPVKGMPQGMYQRSMDRVAKDHANLETEFPGSGKLIAADTEKQLGQFGDFPGKGDPNAPEPPILPGIPSFNPFTGKWTQGGKGGPSGLSMMGQDTNKLAEEYMRNQGNG